MDRVLVVDPINPSAEAILGKVAVLVPSPDSAPQTIRKLARDVDGIITRSKLPDDVFADAPKVRAVAIHGTGIDLVPVEAASARGIMVSNVPGGNAQSVAEYCVTAMLLLARQTDRIIASLKTENWDRARALGAGAHEIADMTLGIVGVGAIGRRLAKICRDGFGMAVLGHQRHLDRLPPQAKPATLAELLEESDFVVVTCPLTPETHHLFNRARIGAMKRTAWLINAGRGSVVEEEALISALKEKRIAGAMLDVYEHYRLEPGHPLLSLDNAILTPHLAGMTVEARARVGIASAEELVRMLGGQPPKNWVNPK